MKWSVDARFREKRPEKIELKVFYLGYNAGNKLVLLGSETKDLTLDKNGFTRTELTSPTTTLSRTRTNSTTGNSNSSGFRSTKTTTRGKRVTGCVVQLFADGELAKSWTSDSRWTIEAKNEKFSIENLNKNSGRIGLK